jgi:hypothetical protein
MTPHIRGPQIPQKSRNCLKLPAARRMPWSKLHPKDPQVLGTTIWNLVAQAAWCPACVHTCLILCSWMVPEGAALKKKSRLNEVITTWCLRRNSSYLIPLHTNAMVSTVGCTTLYMILPVAFLSQKMWCTKNVMDNVKLIGTIRDLNQHRSL